MKTIKLTYLKLVAAMLLSSLLISCQEDEAYQPTAAKGSVEFSPGLLSPSNGRIGEQSDADLSNITIAIQSLQDDSLTETHEIKLYNFNGHWASEQISLATGEYQITRFFVHDSNGKVVYATPLINSKLAHLVNQPLYIRFSVNAGQVTKIALEVVNIIENSPEDFGYASFSFTLIDAFEFLTSTMIYNDTVKGYAFTDAHLSVVADGELLYDRNVSADINRVALKDHYKQYHLMVTKDGYDTLSQTFSAYELKEYTENGEGPLVFTLQKSTNTISAGLIAYYPFWSNTQDYSASGFHMQAYGATLTTDQRDSLDNAYAFDGIDDHMDMWSAMPLQDQVTVSAWIQVADSSAQYGQIVAKYNWRKDKGFHLYIEDGYAGFSGRDGNYEYVKTEANSHKINDGKWHHVVGVCNRNIWQVWVDGVMVAETNSLHSSVNINSNDPLTIGYYYQGNGEGEHQYFEGKIDNIKIYNNGLSADKIKTLYSSY